MKKILFVLSITFGICFTFFINHSSSFAMGSSMALDYALWNAYNIGAEYACSRTARNLENPIYSDVVNISGINDPFSSSQQYGQILWNANGRTGSISQTDIWNAIQQDIQDFDVSSMTSEELSDFLDRCGVILDDVGTNWTIKTSQLNGIRFYWATTKAGDWLGTSFKNILAKFTLSSELIDSVQNESSTIFPYSSDVIFCNSYTNTITDNNINSAANGVTFNYMFSFSDLCVPYQSVIENHNYYKTRLISTNPNLSFTCIRTSSNPTSYPQIFTSGGLRIINSFSLNNDTLYIYETYVNFSSGTHTGIYVTSELSNHQFCNYSDAISYITQNGFLGDTINSELIDSQSVPYSVPEIGELATPITDIYPILESIRNGIISIPTTGELATVLYPSLADSIADAIADAKASSIAIADTQDPSPPNPDDDDDNEFTPVIGWVGDLMPDGMFTMFEPIFSIVPSNYSMYGFWISIPLIILVCIIIYFIVSVL